MKSLLRALPILSCFLLAASQQVTVPLTCNGKFQEGTDEVIFTVPYAYDQVMSIIGSYKNLTWSGNPDNTVSLNGTDNTVGTARTYNLMGIHVVETILTYLKPPAPGPYYEVHNTALISTPPPDAIEAYIPYDATTVTSICDGAASTFNFTARFCATDTQTAGGLLHTLHLTDAQTVGKFLGGGKFSSCQALVQGTSIDGGTAAPSGTGMGGVPAPTVSIPPYVNSAAGSVNAPATGAGTMLRVFAVAVAIAGSSVLL